MDQVTTSGFELDTFDKSILAELSANGRLTMTDLAQRVGLSKTPVLARVRRLEAEGYITGYRAQLSAVKLGLDHIAFIELKLADTREEALSAFNKAVATIPEVEECHMIAGGFDYLLKIRSRDIRDYRRVLSEQISSLPHIASSSTYVVMEAVKDNGVQPTGLR
ncbi:MAG: Lrp/AsnC family transcriptional regulator [Thalassovita sp.]